MQYLDSAHAYVYSDITAAGGDAIFSSVLSFSGTSNFINNSADSGGAIYALGNTVLRFNGINSFMHNCAITGGGISITDTVLYSFNGTNYFINNVAVTTGGTYSSGAIAAILHTVLLTHFT